MCQNIFPMLQSMQWAFGKVKERGHLIHSGSMHWICKGQKNAQDVEAATAAAAAAENAVVEVEAEASSLYQAACSAYPRKEPVSSHLQETEVIRRERQERQLHERLRA
jgi:hypothetical protein